MCLQEVGARKGDGVPFVEWTYELAGSGLVKFREGRSRRETEC